MRYWSKIFTAITFAAVSLTAFNQAQAQETVTLLDRGEPFAAMAAEGGNLWVGHSRLNFNSNYKLQAYRANGTLIAEAPLTHSITAIKATSNGTVVTYGFNPNSRLTQYTIARVDGSQIRMTTTTISLGGFITFWIGNLSGRNYFADMGGNPNDDNDDLSLPAQTLFTATGSSPRYLSTRVRMPVAGEILDGKLYLISSDGIGAAGAKVVEVNPANESVRVLNDTRSGGYSDLWPIPGTRLLLTNARYDQKVVLLNRDTGAVAREFATDGYTRSVATYGHCVVAGSDETNNIEFFDQRSDAALPVMTAVVKLPIEEFSGIKRIAIDQSTGTLFARSTKPCNPMMEVCDKDDNRVVRFTDDVTAEIRAKCL